MAAIAQNRYPNMDPKYLCPRCKQLFTKTAELYGHLKETHPLPKQKGTSEKPFSAITSDNEDHLVKANKDGYESCYSPKKTKSWCNINENAYILLTPPTKRYTKWGKVNIESNDCPSSDGWTLIL